MVGSRAGISQRASREVDDLLTQSDPIDMRSEITESETTRDIGVSLHTNVKHLIPLLMT